MSTRLSAVQGSPNAEPDWNRFARDHADKFQPNATPALKTAVQYFKGSPPRKQRHADGNLIWSEPIGYDEKELVLVWLRLAVRTVRNNLFHGGKFPGYPILDPSRDRSLIGNAIVILDACLKLDPTVRNKFLDGLEP